MTTNVVDIQVFGRTLKLSCPTDQVIELNNAANDLNERFNELRRKTQFTNADQLMITVALNISYELTAEKAKNSQLSKDVSHRLLSLQKSLESALNNINQRDSSQK